MIENMNKTKIIITACITYALCSCQPSADLADTPIWKMPGATDNPFLKNASVTVVFDIDAPQVIWPKILPTDDYSLPRRKIALKFNNELEFDGSESDLNDFSTPIYYNKGSNLVNVYLNPSIKIIKFNRISKIKFNFKNNDSNGLADIIYVSNPNGLVGEYQIIKNIPFMMYKNKCITPVDDEFYNKNIMKEANCQIRQRSIMHKDI